MQYSLPLWNTESGFLPQEPKETSGNVVSLCDQPMQRPVNAEGKLFRGAYCAHFKIISQMNHRIGEQKAVSYCQSKGNCSYCATQLVRKSSVVLLEN